MAQSLPIALTVAGTDPTGGAGVLADIKSFHSREVYGMSAVTSLTAQNTMGVQDVHHVPADFLNAQLESIFSDEIPDAMKSGMIATEEMMKVLKDYVTKYEVPLVIDPVMISTSGHNLISEDAIGYLKSELLPVALTVTPNIMEAEKLTGVDIEDEEDVRKAAKVFIEEIGVKSVIIKGGHLKGAAVDYLFENDNEIRLSSDRVDTNHTHGTGCTFSAVITAELAKGKSLNDAFRIGKNYITKAIQETPEIGKGDGPINHFAYKGEL
ncbi:bifunctional hydroxymethylpyrimidine kinase/phosphomethylpyrimidine kinase [Salinicoccus sp. YB14-2]|uniref:bifunctional hydroxymethylpyrimidine kinase/phosphomethylpyrimidine kinase n=1 Tax=Salinicoccus sp. YB14-2 TaxID=1572701 RepID=UPI0006899FD6|nr:bifunctional hydroxymethylpyrimidine kinase/phosphomethylpyrimidine kinase [Salinicoccus sp. YB14-2]